jgi:type I restriction enzyme M protein
LSNDLFAGTTFDYLLSNPPYGVDWKASQVAVKPDVQRAGERSRFPGGMPPISDGLMLLLQHLATKMRPVHDGGGRAAIVLNGSPLFNGGAESGPLEIRRWLLEHDLVDTIVALPTNMVYNTGIVTYVWVLDNAKPAERRQSPADRWHLLLHQDAAEPRCKDRELSAAESAAQPSDLGDRAGVESACRLSF